jgi:hypothetical protein
MIHPSLSFRFRTNARQMRYLHLHVTRSTNTMFANSKSIQGNKSAQVLCTADGWTLAFAMGKEKDAHDAFSLLFHRDGVPNVMIMDGANVQVRGGGVRRKLRKAGYHIKQTDIHMPKSNVAEGSIRELKAKWSGLGHQSGYGMTAWLGKLMSDHRLH